jgi:hypothetical protein
MQRKRIEDGVTVLTVVVFSLPVYAVYAAFHSLPLTMFAALVCGSAAMWWMPLRGTNDISDQDKRRWLIWFAPALLLEAMALVYFMATATPDSEVFGPSALAAMFGATGAGTWRVLKWSAP